ncbi:hypothetical protein, partial [Burkholderia ubonensis]|uniref:hypothetical protein n=1 Tax=Burkholderia ubonensis TaxID=101571 RepID=UPI001E55F055
MTDRETDVPSARDGNVIVARNVHASFGGQADTSRPRQYDVALLHFGEIVLAGGRVAADRVVARLDRLRDLALVGIVLLRLM